MTRWFKFRKRALTVLTNTANTLLLPLFGPLVSLLVVRLASPEVWGEFVGLLLVMQLGAHMIGWGNKDYLLREFSRHPAQMAAAWQGSLWARGLILGLLWMGLFVWAGPTTHTFWLALWMLALWLDQSYDVLVTYHRAFGFSLLVDGSGLMVTALAVILWRTHLTPHWLTALFASVTLLQALALSLRFRAQVWTTLHRRWPPPHGSFFRSALPFFLLGLSGLLQSRADLYAVNALLPKTQVAHYQVFINFTLYLQALANIILMPFVKSLYRLSPVTLPKISLRLGLLSLVLIGPALLALAGALQMLYPFRFPLAMWLAGGLLILPIYFYLPGLYALFRANQPQRVLLINLLGSGLSFGLSLWLLPRLGMVGAVIAAAVAQWAMGLIYLWQMRQPLPSDDALALPELSRAAD